MLLFILVIPSDHALLLKKRTINDDPREYLYTLLSDCSLWWGHLSKLRPRVPLSYAGGAVSYWEAARAGGDDGDGGIVVVVLVVVVVMVMVV